MLYIFLKQQTKMIILIVFLCSSINSNYVGRVNNTRFTSVDHLNTNAIWLSNFTTWSQCLCAVLSSNLSSSATAINMYRNGSCQLFINLPFTYTMETNLNSTLILLKPLPPKTLAPCCSNLSWLIYKMNTSQQVSGTVQKPSFVFIDNNNLLVTLTYKGALVQFNRTSLDVIQSQTLVTAATGISYRDGFYFIPGCSSSCYIGVFSTKNLSLITSIPLPSSGSVFREIIFLRNNTLMLVASSSNNAVFFFNVTFPTTYTLIASLNISVNTPCGLYAVNDSFIYVTSWYSGYPLYTLVHVNNSWTLSSLPNTAPASGQKIFQTTIDSCGRLWLAITGFGLQIFDPWGRALLYEWPFPANVDGFLLKDNYELYTTDFSNNQIYYINPNISQCTS